MSSSSLFSMPSLVFFLLMSCSVQLSVQSQYCHGDDISALLGLKRSFLIDSSASLHPKVDSWKVEEGELTSNSCCSWDGVECDERTGRVIGLDLSGSSLCAPIHPNSPLFRLLFLQSLNLADNHFNFSQIPTTFGSLSRLSYLNLSSSKLSGQVPTEISRLFNLASLDLSNNPDLELTNLKLGELVGNMSNLQELHLDHLNIASSVPDILANLSSLTSLSLENTGLHGEFPSSIFLLPMLRVLNLKDNTGLRGKLPDFQRNSSPLQVLQLARTSFSGELPSSIGKLGSGLTRFDIQSCSFSGTIPMSFSNLTKLTYLNLVSNSFVGEIAPFVANLTHLQILSVSRNDFNAGSLSWVSKLTRLSFLNLGGTNIHDSDVVPSYFVNLTQLATLYLRENQLTRIPPEFVELTGLTDLDLSWNKLSGIVPPQVSKWTQMKALCFSFNNLHGPIPPGIFDLEHLVYLGLEYNNLTDKVPIDKFFNLKNLTMLHLSGNRISLLGVNNNVAPQKKLHQLGMSSCNLGRFPYFLRNQDELEFLDLSNNKIHGTIPTWIWNTSRDPMRYMNLSGNFLTGFDQPPVLLPWTRLAFLDLSSNKFRGSLPNLPPSTILYSVSNNSLSGNLSPSICKMTYLQALDMSHNYLSGTVPQCLGNFSQSLSTLKLHNNNLEGRIPQRWTKGCKLKLINLSQNKLEGELPEPLSSCGLLESVDLSDNKIGGTFPSWFGTLPELKVLILRSNRFSGAIENQETKTFNNLHILDVSYNNFTGKLPLMFFKNSSALAVISAAQLTYMHSSYVAKWDEWEFNFDVYYSMRMINKATMTTYGKIQEWLTAIDLSSNEFQGEIPKSIGNLKNLHLLNLSHNALTGRIPSSFANISDLEALDLSHNKLSGEIPHQLAQLTFLSHCNVSHNNLVGPIPLGNQFGTFESSSFEENSGLCGTILAKKCGESVPSLATPSVSKEEEATRFAIDIFWVVVLVGYGSGLVLGVSLEHGFRLSRRFQGLFFKTHRW